jgi:hypothetical protein
MSAIISKYLSKERAYIKRKWFEQVVRREKGRQTGKCLFLYLFFLFLNRAFNASKKKFKFSDGYHREKDNTGI